MRASRTFTRREIEGLIAAGDIIVIADSNVLRLNGWKKSHPGGELVLSHMVGRDATDEMNMCVPGLLYITGYRISDGRGCKTGLPAALMSDLCRSSLT